MAFSLVGITILSACKKDRGDIVVDRVPSATLGVYVLCEGPYGIANNSTITYYDIATKAVTQDIFKQKNGIALGSNANDLKQYGSKMYCVVTGTTVEAKDSYVEVIDIASGKSIKRIPFYDANKGFMPRYIQFNKNKAYVSSYDGFISKIDTAALTIETRVKAGEALEEVAIVNNKLYVTNSDFPPYSNLLNTSVSVIDLNTFTKLADILSGLNPARISAVNSGDLFTVARGNYGDIKPAIGRISSVTDKQSEIKNADVSYLKIFGSLGFVIGDWNDQFIRTLDLTTGLPGKDFITDGTKVVTPYSITVDFFNSNVFVADVNNYSKTEGKILAFNGSGKLQYSFVTGSIPQTAVFNYSYK